MAENLWGAGFREVFASAADDVLVVWIHPHESEQLSFDVQRRLGHAGAERACGIRVSGPASERGGRAASAAT